MALTASMQAVCQHKSTGLTSRVAPIAGRSLRLVPSRGNAISRTQLRVNNTGCGPKYYYGGSKWGGCDPKSNQYSRGKSAPYAWGKTMKEFFEQAERMMEQSERSEPFSERESEFTMPFPIDSEQTATSYIITADIPGISKADLKIKVEKRTLSVTAERRRPVESEEDTSRKFRRSERKYGKFGRRLELPEDADVEGITAKCDQGVLTVTVPRIVKEDAEVRDIQIE